MNTNRKNAIIVGALFITATVAGVLSAVLLTPILGDPAYLTKLIENKNQVIMGSLFGVIMAVACAGIAIGLYPVLRKHNEGLALGSVGFRIIEAVFWGVNAIIPLSLLTLSQECIKAGTPDASYFQILGTLLLSVRDSAGPLLGAIAFSLGAFMYYYIFYQAKLIPRWLSGWGLIAIILHLAVALLTMFAIIDPFSTIGVVMNLPIALQEMVLAVWLIAKGVHPSAIASGSVKQI
jgi:hypothetical protein